jgi:hypothetical protein
MNWLPPIFQSEKWQMSVGERAALEGLLAQTKPRLSIEIGTAEGGSLVRIAAYSDEVHSIDLVDTGVSPPPNVRLHVGDSRDVLPRLLERFGSEGRNVDFALVDGDHTAEAVRADLVNLLSSSAVERTVIVLHDTMNESVRAGIRETAPDSFSKVVHVELDLLPGYMARRGPFAEQLWGGLGLVLVDATGAVARPAWVYPDDRYDAYGLIRRLGGSLAGGDAPGPADESHAERRVQALSDELDRHRRALYELQRSPSWRLTAPLRALSRGLRRRSGGSTVPPERTP